MKPMRLFALMLVLVSCSAVEAEPNLPYTRSAFGRWIDADKDCQDTRQEVLIEESEVEVTFTDGDRCRVATGKWTCPLTGEVFTDPRKLDVDHRIALRDAWDMGAWRWTAERRKAFANDLSNLDATSRSANRSKGSKGPDSWLPPKAEARCAFIQQWQRTARDYELELPSDRAAVLSYMRVACARGQAPHLPQP